MISAIILAAGQSKRMGQPKMLLPWGNVTVIEHVISTFLSAGVEDIVVITGSAREYIETATQRYPVRRIHNHEYATGEMLSSLKVGLKTMSPHAEAALVGLGDQPQIQESSVRAVCQAYREYKSSIVVPSHRKRRGHPWLVARPLWKELLALEPSQSPRDFINSHATEIHYVDINSPSVLADLDTPEDYEKSRP